MARRFVIALLFIPYHFICIGQTNKLLFNESKPVINGSYPKNTEINYITIYEHTTLVSINLKSNYNNETIKISSKSNIYDPLNPLFKYDLYSAENIILDKEYTLGPKGNVSTINILFPKIPPGINKINLEIKSNDKILIWQDVVINNPDTHPKTKWTEESLKSFWKINGIKLNEGIYELSNQPISSKLRIGVLQEVNDYKMIFLAGFDAGIWKEGDIQGYLNETAIEGLFKVLYYQGNKELEINFYGNFDNNVLYLSLKDDYRKIDYTFIKLFPTISDDIKINNIIKKYGTGFALSRDGFIATNNHVIDGASKITVSGINNDPNKSYNAKLIISDKINDLAIIKIEDVSFSKLNILPYTIDFSLASVGEAVFVLGYPMRSSMGDEVKLTNGIISSKTGYQGNVNCYTLSVPIQPGNSGGPIFDRNGNIIGIINAKLSDAENVSYAIKTSYLKSLLDIQDKPIQINTSNLLLGKDLIQQVDFVKEFIFMVVSE